MVGFILTKLTSFGDICRAPANGGAGRANPALPGPIFSPIMPGPWVTAVAPQGYFAGGGGGAGYTPRDPANTSGSGGVGGGGAISAELRQIGRAHV